jgi:DNA-binding NarL/FixJ family response regulator
LTRREHQVLTQMTRGSTSNRDLARALCLSENTVRFHVRNILGKLHLHNRAAAVAYAFKNGLVQPADGD